MTNKQRLRHQFPKKFKEGVCRLVLEQGRTRAGVARSLGINASSLGNWKKQIRMNKTPAFPINGNEILTEDQKKTASSTKHWHEVCTQHIEAHQQQWKD